MAQLISMLMIVIVTLHTPANMKACLLHSILKFVRFTIAL
jgi:hypothetical protein